MDLEAALPTEAVLWAICEPWSARRCRLRTSNAALSGSKRLQAIVGTASQPLSIGK